MHHGVNNNQDRRLRSRMTGRRREHRVDRSRTVRSRMVEMLEDRHLAAADCQNTFNRFDVDDDGYLAPRDALVVINDLNAAGSRRLSSLQQTAGYLVDVDGDEFVAPGDVLAVVNQFNLVAASGSYSVPLAANVSPVSDPDGNGVVLRSAILISGQTSPLSLVRARPETGEAATVLADSQGRFELPINLPAGRSTWRVQVVDAQGRGELVERELRLGDVVLNWNASLLNVVRDWTTLSNDPYPNRIVTERPPMAARNLAMVHMAIHDAVFGITRTLAPLQVDLTPPRDASPVAAAASAAHRVATRLYSAPEEIALFDAALAESLATVPDGEAKDEAVRYGQQVGDAILAWRQNDGATASSNYAPRSQPGNWRRTFPDYTPPLLPQWPTVMPFAVDSIEAIRPAPPPLLESGEYAAAVDEVLQLGAFDSGTRTTEQTEIALFWADGGGTATPPGHWNQIAADAALDQQLTMATTTRLLALLNIGMADAGIASWDSKYHYDLWRPIDAIRLGGEDNNPDTTPVPDWIPLLKTPPFPTYVSGHSTFSGAASVILTNFFGDHYAFSSESDGHDSFSQRPLAESQRLRRSFTSFSSAAEEAGRSRIYGGIHFEFDNQAGLALGRHIGAIVLSKSASGTGGTAGESAAAEVEPLSNDPA